MKLSCFQSRSVGQWLPGSLREDQVLLQQGKEKH